MSLEELAETSFKMLKIEGKMIEIKRMLLEIYQDHIDYEELFV